jgi:hypothetical protein
MKNQIKYLVAAITLFSLIACESFTEVHAPDTQISAAQVFADKSTAEAALAHIYARIREEGVVSGNVGGGTVLLATYTDDLIFFGTNTNLEQFSRHTLISSNTFINNLWRATYAHIYAINAFQEGMLASDKIAEQDKKRYLGEAYFLRAYLHFNLMNMFGQIPYITTIDYNVNKNISRNTEAEVLEYLFADLTEAEENIPSDYPSTEPVRPNKAVVHALLARAHLYAENWQLAQNYASLVLENPLYSWQENIQQEFLKENPSIIWSLHPGIAGLNTRDARSFIFTSGPPTSPALAHELYDAFETGDQRKINWIKVIQGNGGPWYQAFKYKKTTNTGTSQEYTILFRLAEQYLIRAEAKAMLNDLQGAKNDLNKIRSRAGLGDTNATTQQELQNAIGKERRFELFTEQGHRFFDLKRTGKIDTVLGLVKPNYKPTNKILPLPENELLLNPNLLPQNPGYE